MILQNYSQQKQSQQYRIPFFQRNPHSLLFINLKIMNIIKQADENCPQKPFDFEYVKTQHDQHYQPCLNLDPYREYEIAGNTTKVEWCAEPKLQFRCGGVKIQHGTELYSIVSAEQLRVRFGPTIMMKEKKCTNIPKFIFNIMMEILDEMEQQIVNGRHKRWLMSIRKRYLGKGHSRSRFSLMELLQNEVRDSAQRIIWKANHRQCLQNKLATHRFAAILTNCSIPDFNKMHYLYYCKLYEWRLNSPTLLGHLT